MPFKPTHGATNTPTFKSWMAMRKRCSAWADPKDAKAYKGVTVCPQWSDFAVFLRDMGERPPGMTLDRYPDPAGNYEPSNCRWATPLEQAVNRSTTVMLEYGGKRQPMKHWARELGMSITTLKRRLDLGWPVDVALTKPIRPKTDRRTKEAR